MSFVTDVMAVRIRFINFSKFCGVVENERCLQRNHILRSHGFKSGYLGAQLLENQLNGLVDLCSPTWRLQGGGVPSC
ncbi:hypothetical protein J6590_093805 [Homalodisca vitripennis]|nr:hypothetical protein J6590_069338 [Homalodisca vitripennis]KAG8310154.1 hypothetical protein J6590_069339 [Homalodisca vitripennis]KAG8314381.1 hypothetical protein J6590_093805 [Homalodisca vitripennis]